MTCCRTDKLMPFSHAICTWWWCRMVVVTNILVETEVIRMILSKFCKKIHSYILSSILSNNWYQGCICCENNIYLPEHQSDLVYRTCGRSMSPPGQTNWPVLSVLMANTGLLEAAYNIVSLYTLFCSCSLGYTNILNKYILLT